MPGCGLQVLARLQQQQQRYREYLVSRYRHLARRSPCQISQYLVQSTDANVYIPALRDVSATFRGSPPAVFPLIGLPIILRLLRCHKKAGLISRYRLGLLTSLSLRCVSYPFYIRSPAKRNSSLPKNLHLMTMPALPLHRFHIRTPPICAIRWSSLHTDIVCSSVPIAPLLRSCSTTGNIFFYTNTSINFLHPKRPTASTLFRLNNNSNSRVVSVLARSSLKQVL